MKRSAVVILLLPIIVLLAGCSTATVTKKLDDTVTKAADVAQRCSDPRLAAYKSLSSLEDDAKEKLLGEFGLSTATQYNTKDQSISATISDLKAQATKLKANEQKDLTDVLTTLNKLRDDVKTAQKSAQTAFSTWKTSATSACSKKDVNVSCIVDTLSFAETLANSIRDDSTQLRTDVTDLRTKFDIFKKKEGDTWASIATANAAELDISARKNIDVDVTQAEKLINTLFVIVDTLNDRSNSEELKDDSKILVARLELDAKEELNQFLAFEVVNYSMRELDRVGRKLEIKLDEVDQKMWFLPELLGLTYTYFIATPEVQCTMNKLLPDEKIAEGIGISKHDIRLAVAAYACSSLSDDTSVKAGDASNAAVLMYPIYLDIIEAFTDEEGKKSTPCALSSNQNIEAAKNSTPSATASTSNAQPQPVVTTDNPTLVTSSAPIPITSPTPPTPVVPSEFSKITKSAPLTKSNPVWLADVKTIGVGDFEALIASGGKYTHVGGKNGKTVMATTDKGLLTPLITLGNGTTASSDLNDIKKQLLIQIGVGTATASKLKDNQ